MHSQLFLPEVIVQTSPVLPQQQEAATEGQGLPRGLVSEPQPNVSFSERCFPRYLPPENSAQGREQALSLHTFPWPFP